MSHILIFDTLYTVTQSQRWAPFVRRWLRGRQGGVELENDLVFEASVEVFMWEDNRVENYHLGRDVDVTTWGGKKTRTKAVLGRRCVLHFNYFNLPFPPRPFMNQ